MVLKKLSDKNIVVNSVMATKKGHVPDSDAVGPSSFHSSNRSL